MTRVMAIDAGQSTGASIIDYHNGCLPSIVHVVQFKLDVQETAWHLNELLSGYQIEKIVVEQFDLRPNNKFLADLTTVEVNGALKALWGEGNIVWQTPAQAKGLISDAVLKNLGAWPTGKTVGQKDANDARDALRHNFRYGVEVLKHRKTIEAGWPKPKED